MENRFKRLAYIDMFRGLALLVMITIQIFDYLSVSSIYTTAPYYVKTINSVTWIPPSLLFSFVSGMSIYVLISKIKSKGNARKLTILKDIIRRYGIYVLISLPFTTFMWNIETYLGWNEVIQGIGLTAIFAAAVLLFTPNTKMKYINIAVIIIIFAFLQSYLFYNIDAAFPQYPRNIGLENLSIISLILNAFIRGWFSVVNILPIMLGGTLFIIMLKNEKNPKKIAIYSSIPLLISIIMHISGNPIDYYGRSSSLTFFAIGESAMMCSLIYYAYTANIWNKTQNMLNVLGRTTIISYLGHYILILKVLELTHLKDIFPDIVAWIITIPLTIAVYYGAKMYLNWKKIKIAQ
ncbi:MAG: hypothetical protein U9O53_04095 [archaeon]|nr:hypothetical protein [archaeon]